MMADTGRGGILSHCAQRVAHRRRASTLNEAEALAYPAVFCLVDHI